MENCSASAFSLGEPFLFLDSSGLSPKRPSHGRGVTTPSIGRRLFNLLTRTFGTNIHRSFEPMISELPVTVLKDDPVLFSGFYRAILLNKDSRSH